jgi:hypothetical protein
MTEGQKMLSRVTVEALDAILGMQNKSHHTQPEIGTENQWSLQAISDFRESGQTAN